MELTFERKLLVINLVVIAIVASIAWHFKASLPMSLVFGFLAASALNLFMVGRGHS